MHKALKAGAAHCQGSIDFKNEAVEVFETKAVKGRLKTMMDLVIRILRLISKYYSKGYLGEVASFMVQTNALIGVIEKIILTREAK